MLRIDNKPFGMQSVRFFLESFYHIYEIKLRFARIFEAN